MGTKQTMLWASMVMILTGCAWPLYQWILFDNQQTASPGTVRRPVTLRSTLPSQPSAPVSMVVVGDIMLDRHIREIIMRHGPSFIFDPIRSQLQADLVIGNLEGPFTTNASPATNTELIFTFDPLLAPAIKKQGFTALSLANNHTLNFGQRGLDHTRQVLSRAGIDAFGDPKNKTGFTVINTINGQTIGLVGYHGLTKGLGVVLEEIRDLELRVDVTVVMAHWGTEYQRDVSQRQRTDAHQLIEAGADIVIGSHPHVVQPVEIYQHKLIAYSLGNFVFDQYFSADTREGMMLKITLTRGEQVVEFIPTVIQQQQIQLLEGIKRQILLHRISENSLLSEAQKTTLRSGIITTR